MNWGYKEQSNLVRTQIEVLNNIGEIKLSDGLTELKDSMKRIESMDDPTQALQDHFNAMSKLSNAELLSIKSLPPSTSIFNHCELLLKLLVGAGARFRVS